MSAARRSGFSLIEVMVAMVILTFGVLALASATGFFFTQIRVADADTDRNMAVTRTIEQIRSQHFDSVKSVSESYAVSRGGYTFWQTVTAVRPTLKEVKIYSRGRGFDTQSGWTATALDSFSISIASSMQPR